MNHQWNSKVTFFSFDCYFSIFLSQFFHSSIDPVLLLLLLPTPESDPLIRLPRPPVFTSGMSSSTLQATWYGGKGLDQPPLVQLRLTDPVVWEKIKKKIRWPSTRWFKQMFTVVWASASCSPLRWIKYSTWKQHQRDISLPLRNQGLVSREAFLNLQITCLQTLITCAVAKDGQNCRTSHEDSLSEGCVRPADDCIPERLTTFGLTVQEEN